MKLKIILKQRFFPLFQALLLYIILIGFFLPIYLHQINPDGISYICIAQKYINFDFPDAINGYWGPLLSWLLMPFLLIGIKPLIASKILSILIGIVTIYQTNKLLDNFKIIGILKIGIIDAIVINIVYFALNVFTPDLLFLLICVVLINIIINSKYVTQKNTSIKFGIFGSFLYLSKSYGFPFFIGICLISHLILFLRNPSQTGKKIILKKVITSMVAFLLISSFWITTISIKYNDIIIGTSGSYNRAIMNKSFTPNHPMDYKGLLAPSNKTAISVWEDISYTQVENWNIFDSKETAIHELKLIKLNLNKIKVFLKYFSSFSLIIILFSILKLLQLRRKAINDNTLILLTFLFLLFSGYILILVEDRYIWLSIILLLILGARLINDLDILILFHKLPKLILIIALTYSFVKPPLQYLQHKRYNEEYIYNVNQNLLHYNIEGKIASTGNWAYSQYLSFYNEWKYYGECKDNSPKSIIKELKQFKIDYLLIWDQKINFNSDELINISDNDFPRLIIYKTNFSE